MEDIFGDEGPRGGAVAPHAWSNLWNVGAVRYGAVRHVPLRRIVSTQSPGPKGAYLMAVSAALAFNSIAVDQGKGALCAAGATGVVVAEVIGPDGVVKSRYETHNLITTAGDQVYAARGAGLGTPAAPTGMKLGTGTTAVAKTGAGAALVTYITGSNKAFDATYPSNTGNQVVYKRTYAPGEATNSAIAEVVLVNDAIATDATSAAANTVSRALFGSPINKAAADQLAVTWTHTITGA